MDVTTEELARPRARLAMLALAFGLPAASLLQAPAVGGTAQDAAREHLLAGVASLERVGVPGVVAVLGPDAFAVVAGEGDRGLPVAAAAHADEGRVVALAHDGFLSIDAERWPGAARLVENALDWLGGEPGTEDKPRRVGLIDRNDALADALRARGFAVEQVRAPYDCEVVVWRGGSDLLRAEREALAAYVEDGGGLLCAVCPWGWAQTRPGWRLQDMHTNDVIAPFGLAFLEGTSSAGGDDAFAVGAESLEAASAWSALAALRDGEDLTRIHAIEHALRTAPYQAKAFRALVEEVLGDALEDDVGPRPERPLRASDARGRLAVTRALLAWRAEARTVDDLQDFAVAPGARAFPGAVPDEAETVMRNVQLAAEPPGWRSTGLYLPPGGAMLVHAYEGGGGWRLRVGAHRDALWRKDTWKRWPEITEEVPLTEERTWLASAFGGPVYLIPPKEDAAPISVIVMGCVEAPIYDLADPRAAETWESHRRRPAPWAELVGRHVVMTVPSAAVRALEDPAPLIEFWDAVMVAHCELGAEPLPARPERFVADVQISAGYMHAGYPIMTHVDVVTPQADGTPAIQLDLERLRSAGSWGHFHELGHNRQKGAWTFGGTGEVTCNLFSLHAAQKLCGIEPWEHPWLANHKAAARGYLEAPDFEGVWKRKAGLALVTYAELQREFGWEPFRAAFAAYHDVPAPRGDDAEIATWIRRISLACERDLRPFFRRWGWPIAPELESDAELGELAPWAGASDVASW